MHSFQPLPLVKWSAATRPFRHFWSALRFGLLTLSSVAALAAADLSPELVVTNDLVLSGEVLRTRLVVRASHIVIDGQGATLIGPGQVGDPKSLETAGTGVSITGLTGVTVKNLKVQGFATGLALREVRAASILECDFSDNYHNPKHGWGELPPRGGILCERVQLSVFRGNRASRVWDGLHLIDSDDNLVADNDFSSCSNTAAKLWKSSRNKFLNNNLSYGIRIDRAAGEVHARDSTGVLIETGSDDNYWYQNDITHGGDGIFIRPLNRWVSRGNVFVENDTSYANNNCVESWSPGNTFIRNRANHGSYGFWLGGSDQTVLIDNEAAYNGLPTGNHNAPEPGFGHGGIVIVGGSSSHTLIQGNHIHNNHGAGIAFRGDVASRGRQWRTEHWIIQQNRIVSNRFGLWGRWGDVILLAANVLTSNAQGNYLTNVTHLTELSGTSMAALPAIELLGPTRLEAGQLARFEPSLRTDQTGRSLNFQWWLEGDAGSGPVLERTLDQPGFYRLGLTVHNGSTATLAWRDLLVTRPVPHELGTEGSASQWGFDLEGDDQKTGRVQLADDEDSVVGKQSLRLRPDPYPGAYATVHFPKTRDAAWDFSQAKEVRFWAKALNPNLPGFQNAGPVIRLLGKSGQITLRPAKDGNLLNDPPFSEARWLWMPVRAPLTGEAGWQASSEGTVDLARIDAISLSFDSWGGDPFTIWIDGLTVE